MKAEFKISFFTFCAWVFYSANLESSVNAQTLGFGLNNADPIHIEASDGIEWHKNKKLYIARGDAKDIFPSCNASFPENSFSRRQFLKI